MARSRNNNRIKRRQRKRSFGSGQPVKGFKRAKSLLPAIIQFGRTVLCAFPMTPEMKLLVGVFDFILSFVRQEIVKDKTYAYIGARAMYYVTPGMLIRDSPLLAEVSGNYSFPGNPIQVKKLRIVMTSTTVQAGREGKWAAVFIPFREMHDEKPITSQLATITFSDLCQMPHSITARCTEDLIINYRFRNAADYCSRPRELSERIGVVIMIWDDYDRSGKEYSSSPDNTDFAYETEISGTYKPYVIFGSRQRKQYPADTFAVKSVSEKTLTLTTCGERRLDAVDPSHFKNKFGVSALVRSFEVLNSLDMDQ